MNDTLITRDGLDKLTADLEQLRTAARAQIVERIRDAASSESNAAESVGYQDALEEQALLERRIALLEERLAAAVVAEPDAGNDAVDLGERVTVRNLDTGDVHEYQLVGSFEAAPSEGRISAASPLGQALLGCAPGDVAVFDAPRGRLRFEIVLIAGERRRRSRSRRPPVTQPAA